MRDGQAEQEWLKWSGRYGEVNVRGLVCPAENPTSGRQQDPVQLVLQLGTESVPSVGEVGTQVGNRGVWRMTKRQWFNMSQVSINV